jgi:myo-inositol-1(or 4)-monophosphatase
MARSDRRRQGVHAKSGPTDLASDADLAAEAAIRRVLAEQRPGDEVIGEEGGSSGGKGENALRWVVDPLDGTINYLFEIPLFAVSVACQDSDGTIAGVVLDPSRGECFTATRSAVGPCLNGVPIVGSERDELATALVATGFAYNVEWRRRQAQVAARLLPEIRDIRRCGAAALDLAWVACGRFDAFYERGLNAWDAAAGTLVCERAGLVVRELPARDEDPPGIIAAPAGLIDSLMALVAG